MFAHNMAIASMFGKPSTAVQNAIQQTHNMLMSTIGNSGFGAQFLQQAQETFHDLNFGATAMQIDSMRSQHTTVFQQETIVATCTIGEIQNANAITRRVVMATPDVREAYQAGEISGYGDLYSNSSPTGIGATHYDYRVFTSGLVNHVRDDDGKITSSEHSWYYESTKEDYAIGIQEKRAAHITMMNAAYLINNDDYDCTSVDNELL